MRPSEAIKNLPSAFTVENDGELVFRISCSVEDKEFRITGTVTESNAPKGYFRLGALGATMATRIWISAKAIHHLRGSEGSFLILPPDMLYSASASEKPLAGICFERVCPQEKLTLEVLYDFRAEAQELFEIIYGSFTEEDCIKYSTQPGTSI